MNRNTFYVSREFMQIVVVIICNDNSYIQKSGHYDANKTTGVVFSLNVYVKWVFIFYYIFILELLFFVKVINFFALPWG